jgi:hypothetical protein
VVVFGARRFGYRRVPIEAVIVSLFFIAASNARDGRERVSMRASVRSLAKLSLDVAGEDFHGESL